MVLDLAFPPRCPSCKGPSTADGNFCAECFSKVRLIGAPLCTCCGIPFEIALEKEMRCPECLDTPPLFSQARAVMVYDAVSAPLISSLKFHDQWAGIARHAQMMQRAGAEILPGVDMLVPVPLHWRRLVRRKFNQSALLAYGISQLTALPCMPQVLQRVRFTKPQMRLDRKLRLHNVKKAFAVARGGIVAGKTILLIDDVVTTGATANACAAALKQAGAKEVRVLSLARTVKE